MLFIISIEHNFYDYSNLRQSYQRANKHFGFGEHFDYNIPYIKTLHGYSLGSQCGDKAKPNITYKNDNLLFDIYFKLYVTFFQQQQYYH